MENSKTIKYSDNYLNSCENYTKAYNYLLISKQVLDDIEKVIKAYKDCTKDYQKKLYSLKASIAKTFYVDDCLKLKNDDSNYKTINSFIKIVTSIVTFQINKITDFFTENTPTESVDDALNILKKNKSYLETEKKKMDKNFLEYDSDYKKLLSKYNSTEDKIRDYYVESRKNKTKDSKIYDDIFEDLTNSAEKFRGKKNNFEENNSQFFALYDKCIKDIDDELNKYNTSLYCNIITFINNCCKYHTELSKSINNFLENTIIKENLEIIQDFNEFQKNNFFKIEKICEEEKYRVKAVKEKFIETKIENKDKEIINDFYETFGYDDTIKDEHTILTDEDVYKITQFFHAFDFVDFTDYDLTLEKKKIAVKDLTNKILCFKLKNSSQDEYSNLKEITQVELNDLYQWLEKKEYRHAFLHRLNNYRSLGCFELPEKEFNIISKCLKIIIDSVLSDNDLYSAKLVIILSQTFYMIENEKKKYLFKEIYGHKIFQEKKIWTEYLDSDLKTETEKFNTTKKRNSIGKTEEPKSELSEIGAFGQILPFCSNMIDFGMSEDVLEEIVKPFIEKYKLDDEMIQTLNGIIKENIQKRNKK